MDDFSFFDCSNTFFWLIELIELFPYLIKY